MIVSIREYAVFGRLNGSKDGVLEEKSGSCVRMESREEEDGEEREARRDGLGQKRGLALAAVLQQQQAL